MFGQLKKIQYYYLLQMKQHPVDVQIWSLLAIDIPRILESTDANNLLGNVDVKMISMRFILLHSSIDV